MRDEAKGGGEKGDLPPPQHQLSLGVKEEVEEDGVAGITSHGGL